MNLRPYSTMLGFLVILLLGLAVAFQSYRLRRAELAEIKARAERQGMALAAANFQRAAEASQRELSETVPELKEQLEIAKKEKARILAATHFEGKADTIRIPAVCSTYEAPSVGGEPPAPSSNANPPESTGGASPGFDVDTFVRLDEAIVADDAGGIYIARNVDVQLTTPLADGKTWYSGWRPVKGKNVTGETAVDPDLTKAWAAWKAPKPSKVAVVPRAFREWRVGWSCGGGGGVLTTGSAGAGFFCVLGPQL